MGLLLRMAFEKGMVGSLSCGSEVSRVVRWRTENRRSGGGGGGGQRLDWGGWVGVLVLQDLHHTQRNSKHIHDNHHTTGCMALWTNMGLGITAPMTEEHRRLVCVKACRELAVANAYTSFS